MLKVGFDNYLNRQEVIAIVPINSKSAARAKKKAIDEGKLINCSANSGVASLIYLKGGFVAASAIRAESLYGRFVNP